MPAVPQNYTDVAGTDYGYEYDSNGLLTRRTGDGAEWSYRYDAIDRLVATTQKPGSGLDS